MRSIRDEMENDGYVVIEDFLTPNEIEDLIAAGKELSLEAPKEDRKFFTAESESQNSQYREEYFMNSGDKICYFYEKDAVDENGELKVDSSVALNKIGHALHTDHPTFKNITFSTRVKEICWSLGLSRPAIPQSMYIFKNPGVGGLVKSHQDSTYLYTDPCSLVGFWIALDDATVQNGCLQFIRGSHKSGVHRRLVRNPDKDAKDLVTYDRPESIYPMSNFVNVPVPKGACILIHGQVVHRSEPNKSDLSRHAYTFHVIETKNAEYSKDNWLQPPAGDEFPVLYEKL